MPLSSYEIPCVILCGGKSSRMGEDKALLPFNSKPTLTQYQYERLKPYFKEVYISSKSNKFDFHCNIILDTDEIYSPIVALKSIFETLKDEEKIFIITVDTPLVSIESIQKIIENSHTNQIIVAKTERIHNLCGVFNKDCLTVINKMLKDDFHKVGFLLKELNSQIITFENEDEFLNLNNPDEYKKALNIIS